MKTNEQGYSFEIYKDLTDYAHEDNHSNGNKGLPSYIVVLKVTKEDKLIGFMLFDTAIQKPLSDAIGVEAMACKIDAIKFVYNSNDRQNNKVVLYYS